MSEERHNRKRRREKKKKLVEDCKSEEKRNAEKCEMHAERARERGFDGVSQQ